MLEDVETNDVGERLRPLFGSRSPLEGDRERKLDPDNFSREFTKRGPTPRQRQGKGSRGI